MGDFSALLWVALALTAPPFVVGALAAVRAMREDGGDEGPPGSH